MQKRTPSRKRKVVPIAEAVEQRRKDLVRKDLRDLADGAADLGDDREVGHLIMVGNMALLEGAYEEAIDAFSRALALAPGAPDAMNAHSGRGRARAALGEHALALADFDHAAALAPDQARHHLGRANRLAMLGNMKEAVAAASRAIELAPNDAGAHYTRAVYRSHLDDNDPGVRPDLDRTVELAPREALYLEKRAEYLLDSVENPFDSREFDAALADVDRALALAPDDARLHLLRGKCLHGPVPARVGDCYDDEQIRCEAALASLDKAMALAPSEGELRKDILWAMVCVRDCMGDQEAFLAILDRALAELPEDELAIRSVRDDRLRRPGRANRTEGDG